MTYYESAKGEVITFRQIGDFYEAFDDDAEVVGRELSITVTKRRGQRMAGVPYHAIDRYVQILRGKGFDVRIVSN